MISLKSKVTGSILNYFFINPGSSLYVNELSEKLSLDKRNLVKKLKELEKEGLLKSEPKGNLKLYSGDKKYPLYNEYKKIILKTLGFEKKLADLLKDVKGIETVYIYGSYAENRLSVHSDIDLLVIGNHKIISLQKKVSRLQKEIDREINAVSMAKNDFNKRKRSGDPFIKGVLKKKYIEIAL
ncbi:MAG: nucleotidyltransferase domain-containing protein [Candidatus Omnitrophica bacterium]|nr:nucleotidyltransferase domain-containing protein [Candidatus Omnitrophota bacterium]